MFFLYVRRRDRLYSDELLETHYQLGVDGGAIVRGPMKDMLNLFLFQLACASSLIFLAIRTPQVCNFVCVCLLANTCLIALSSI